MIADRQSLMRLERTHKRHFMAVDGRATSAFVYHTMCDMKSTPTGAVPNLNEDPWTTP